MKNIRTIVLLFLIISCAGVQLEEFSFSKESYTGNEIRIDGFYYDLNYSDDLSSFLFFYRNGVIHGPVLCQGHRDLEGLKVEVKNYKARYDSPSFWGIYKVNKLDLYLERRIVADRIEVPVLSSRGKILNDTTFVLESDSYKGTMMFEKFSPKPDSTNNYTN